MKDSRTLTNTPRLEILKINSDFVSRKEWNEKRRLDLLPEQACPHCETKFKPKRFWQKFCCADCRLLFFRNIGERQQAELELENFILKTENEELKKKLEKP